MYSLKHGNEMDNMDYSNLRNQGYYDQSAANQQNFLNASMQMNAAHMGLNDGLGAGGLGMSNVMMWLNKVENMIPRNDQNINYYQEYCRLFIANVVLTTQMKELISEKNELLTRLAELERGEKSVTKGGSKTPPELTSEKKSRIRRKAADVERHYKCPGSNCQKSYGSEGSLIQHVKLKHAELTDNPDWKVKILKLGEGEGEGGEGDADSQE